MRQSNAQNPALCHFRINEKNHRSGGQLCRTCNNGEIAAGTVIAFSSDYFDHHAFFSLLSPALLSGVAPFPTKEHMARQTRPSLQRAIAIDALA
jgi:hypothetical protein